MFHWVRGRGRGTPPPPPCYPATAFIIEEGREVYCHIAPTVLRLASGLKVVRGDDDLAAEAHM